ncbi:MAG TPA: carboxypeptidase-like regulatory domain-containing protein, partial [Bryobacteraceae bacterium]|nr:carboxypeptidase-like regulatory domain-containing protein [Bryobacteraceae bacterium]
MFACAVIWKLAAQTPNAVLVGSVVDPAGSAVAGAKVEVRNSGTNEVRTTESDQKGEFTAPNLKPGIYDVTISRDGFRSLHETGLELQLDQQARMEYHLQLGSLA